MRLPKIRAARERTGSMIATIMNFPMRRGTTILKVLFSSLKKKRLHRELNPELPAAGGPTRPLN